MRICQKFVALLLIVLLAGCASTQALNESDRQALQAVRLNGEVAKTGEMYLLAPGAAIGMMFGAVGGAIAGVASLGPAQTLQAFAEKNGVSIERIAREEVDAALKASGKVLLVANGEKATATLTVQVEQFGFSVPTAVSSKVVPVVALRCQMVDRTGKVIWSASDRVLPSVFTVVDSVAFAEMKADPTKIEAAWRQAARIIAENIVKSL